MTKKSDIESHARTRQRLNETSPSRRRFMAATGAAGAISALEWLGFFRDHGVPGTAKDWGIANARAQEDGGVGAPDEPRLLFYWFIEGGWLSYSMFSPLDTANHSPLSIPAGTLNPTPPWSSQFYRVTAHENAAGFTQTWTGADGGQIPYGYLAAPGVDLFPDICAIASHDGNTFHSGSRFDYQYGRYNRSLTAYRQPDERTVMQAFAEEKGAAFTLPNIAWHRWLSDGELDMAQYPEGTGYYEKLGPPHAHTVYGRTPGDLKSRLAGIGDVAVAARRQRIRQYTDTLHSQFLNGKDGQSVRAFSSALEIHRAITSGGITVDLNTLFNDNVIREEFGVTPGDEVPSYRSVNGNPARSKDTPHIRTQSMMAYELARAGISCSFFLENRDVRQFDSHFSRQGVMNVDSHPDQLNMMIEELWDPLRILVARLKGTEMPGLPGRSMFDQSTIVVCSEMGRTIQGDVGAILTSTGTDNEKYNEIMEQDVCQHWKTSSVFFMGGNVNGGRSFGRVGSQTLAGIPTLSDGSLDPAYNSTTGVLNAGQTGTGEISDAGNVYSTALYLAGIDPTGKGRNTKGPLTFVKKDV